MPPEPRRKTPEELLRQAEAEEAAFNRGKLKIFLGYASGVGKSFRMLDEARRRRERGQDVVVGALQPSMPPEIEPLLAKLEITPSLVAGEYSAIDLSTLLRRHPGVCVIDGLAYDNPPGFRNGTRWEDVQHLLSAGVSVITSINIQYVDELREQVEAITGKHVTQTVPVAFIKSADEIEIVDASPQEGGIAHPLSQLRELALVLAADIVDHQLTDYLHTHGIQQHFGANERILVCITPRANVGDMMDTARMIADKFHGELIAAYVHQPGISAADQAALDAKLALARSAGASVEILDGEDAVDTIVDFARSRRVTQLFIGHSQRSGLWARAMGNPVDKLIRRSQGMDVRVFPQ